MKLATPDTLLVGGIHKYTFRLHCTARYALRVARNIVDEAGGRWEYALVQPCGITLIA